MLCVIVAAFGGCWCLNAGGACGVRPVYGWEGCNGLDLREVGGRHCWQVGNCIGDVDVLANASGMVGCIALGVVINNLAVHVQILRIARWSQSQLF